MTFPFEVPFERVQGNPEAYIEAIFACLVSEFLVLPRGRGFIEYPVFERGYEVLKQATAGFREGAPSTRRPRMVRLKGYMVFRSL